jgi:FkbM family methyltransferase
MKPADSLTVRALSRIGHPRLRRIRAQAITAGPLPAAAVRRLEARQLTVLAGRGQGLRFDLRHVRIDHAHFGAIVHGLLETSVQEAFIRHLGEGGVLYDIGANVGFFSLLGARLVGDAGHVYSFEPAPENCTAILEHAALNGAHNVTLVPRAASSRSGRGRLQLVDDRSWSKLEGYGAHPGTERVIDVDLVAVDELVRSGELRPPSVVKIDVEGAELEVLDGLRTTLQQHGPAVICELHDTQPGFVNAMAEAGYHVINLEGSRPVDERPPSPHALALPTLAEG